MKSEKKPELIVMLTHNDHTVEDADKVFESCRQSKALYFGFKEHGFEWGGDWSDRKDYQHFEISTTLTEILYPNNK